jgi:hypothetical protein
LLILSITSNATFLASDLLLKPVLDTQMAIDKYVVAILVVNGNDGIA